MPSLAAVNLGTLFPFGILKLSAASCAAARPALPRIVITARTNRFMFIFLRLRALRLARLLCNGKQPAAGLSMLFLRYDTQSNRDASNGHGPRHMPICVYLPWRR